MSKWTDGANKQWQLYTEKLKTSLDKDSDAEEVISDVRMHVEAELQATKITIATEDDLKRILDRMGLPEKDSACANSFGCDADKPSVTTSTEAKEYPEFSGFKLFMLVAFGIILPVISVVVELCSGMCADVFFDPIPTILHVLVFLAIPLSNFLCLISFKKETPKVPSKLGFFNAFALGISIVYTFYFIPLLPVAPFAIMAFGLGFCALAPLLALIATLICRRHLKTIALRSANKKVPCFWPGLCVAILAIVLLGLQSFITDLGIKMANSDSSATSVNGIHLLRVVGDKDILVESCYRQRRGFNANIITHMIVGPKPTTEAMRAIYYRVTGQAFNTVPAADLGIGRNFDFIGDFDFDQSTSNVGTQLKGLSMQSSRIDGSIDSDAAIGYLEWTMVFKNESQWQQREARGQIKLPAGSVVSRLTLWIDGEEREAAFASRVKTRQAYESVVRRQRDPVLVTTSGPDRILMQCFPVPPNGGVMKVRIGITVPLQMLTDNKTVLSMPHFNERNFLITDKLEHAVWLESRKELKTSLTSLLSETPKKELYALRGNIDNKDLLNCSVLSFRDSQITHSWTKDPLKGSDKIIIQTIEKATAKAPDHIVIVVDSSEKMDSAIASVIDAISNVPPQIKKTLIVTDDNSTPSAISSTAIDQRLKNIETVGGMDNVPALELAWDEAVKQPNSIILWIHAAQPVILKPVDSLQQRWDRRPNGPTLIEIQVMPGMGRVAESLDGLRNVSTLPRTGVLSEDIQRLFNQWDGTEPVFSTLYKRIAAEDKPAGYSKQTSSHLARLWAKEHVEELRHSDSTGAIVTATSYQLVTPVSGAVVLENMDQYKQSGLEPVDPATVPTIPEPEFWAMLAIVAIILCLLLVRRNRMLCLK